MNASDYQKTKRIYKTFQNPLQSRAQMIEFLGWRIKNARFSQACQAVIGIETDYPTLGQVVFGQAVSGDQISAQDNFLQHIPLYVNRRFANCPQSGDRSAERYRLRSFCAQPVIPGHKRKITHPLQTGLLQGSYDRCLIVIGFGYDHALHAGAAHD